ncbi:MAG: S8 family serine peptidase, partial [Rhodocyclaceae bacterium]|nr:S8 family serine peptidase [Rhodocyclaceae bacterium]
MMLHKMSGCAAALMLVWGAAASQAQALSDGVLVKLRAEPSVKVLSNADYARSLSAATKKTVKVYNGPAPEIRLVRGDGTVSDAELAAALQEADNVEFAAPNRIKQAQAVPNDPLFAQQWYLQSGVYGAIRAQGAWDITTGSPSVPVAVVDTGVRPDHPDLKPNLLPGYDFVDMVEGAADPGDFIPGDPDHPSSWHGTKVSGLIAAAGNNSEGIAGLNWNGRIVPVRSLGKGGGTDASLIAGVRWAAGLPVTGVPDNPNPVKIINASFGKRFGDLPEKGTCRVIPGSPHSSPFWAELASELIDKGVMLVVSAGNGDQGLLTGGGGVPVSEPANCPGVIAVAAVTADGYKTEYSSFGPEVFISAPGGEGCYGVGASLSCGGLWTTTNLGTTVPGGNGYSAEGVTGTSFSAPLVAGTIALMLSANPALSADDVKVILKETARPFPYDPSLPLCAGTYAEKCNCTTDTCGAGILDTEAAVKRAQNYVPPQPESQPQPEPQPE